MMVFSLMVICPTSLIGSALEVQGAGDDALVFDLPPDFDIEGQLDRHLEAVRAVVVLAIGYSVICFKRVLCFRLNFDVAVLDEWLQGLDASVFCSVCC